MGDGASIIQGVQCYIYEHGGDREMLLQVDSQNLTLLARSWTVMTSLVAHCYYYYIQARTTT
jgi:hypothetical protein